MLAICLQKDENRAKAKNIGKKTKDNKKKKNSRTRPGFSDALISATMSQHDKEEKAGGPDDPTYLLLNTKNHRQKLNLP